MQFQYKDPSTIGNMGWCCCALGFLVFTLIFGFRVLPDLQEEWQWTPDLCFVVSKDASCLELGCQVSVNVLLDSLPVCSERKCDKRNGTVFGPEGKEAEVWLLVHEENTSFPCYQRAITDEILFETPSEVSNDEMMLPFLISAIFFLPSCVLIPAFMKKDSSAARLLESLGVRRVVDDDALTLVQLPSDADMRRQQGEGIMMDEVD
mmetsp:Transcript_44348/g.90509  ORF Transcript_44348/g.90509 Transcript_44348/m.90509 type:complete len:206 (-) Transcript_44348:80-697(-)